MGGAERAWVLAAHSEQPRLTPSFLFSPHEHAEAEPPAALAGDPEMPPEPALQESQ